MVMEDNTFQQEVTKRLQTEIGNLIVQLTMKGVEIDQLKAENLLLKQERDRLFPVSDSRPVSGHLEGTSNGNK
jgi:hypothetical protein